MSAFIRIQNKHIRNIETNNGVEDPLDSSDDKSVLNLFNRDNHTLGHQGQGSTKKKKCGG